jgi:hypothetical protein
MTAGEIMKNTTSLIVSVAVLLGSISFAKDTPKPNPLKDVLLTVPAAELPAKAADVVSQAKGRDRAATTANAVKAAIEINPAAAPAIVGAIAAKVPEMASTAAGVAAAEQPKQAAAVAKAAAAAAPSQARQIVLAVCRAAPNAYRGIAAAVSQAVPSANKAILNAVAAALPDLKPYIEKAVLALGGNVSSVPTVLDRAASMARTATASGPALTPVARVDSSASQPTIANPTAAGTPVAPLARGPAVGPPYIPLITTPTNVTPGGSGEVPVDGRDYAAP